MGNLAFAKRDKNADKSAWRRKFAFERRGPSHTSFAFGFALPTMLWTV